jgi:hypothetical protein
MIDGCSGCDELELWGAAQLAAQRWARAGWSWSKSAGMEPVLVRARPKVLVPLMDHQVEESVHQDSHERREVPVCFVGSTEFKFENRRPTYAKVT